MVIILYGFLLCLCKSVIGPWANASTRRARSFLASQCACWYVLLMKPVRLQKNALQLANQNAYIATRTRHIVKFSRNHNVPLNTSIIRYLTLRVEGHKSHVYTGLLILRDGAISHNRPQIASNRTIHKKSHNSQKITHYSQNQP